jgi:carboxyl-terminal processing protease
MNENSASASEILTGAVQDNDRGTIVGRSLWKGFGTTRNEFEGWVSGTFNSC